LVYIDGNAESNFIASASMVEVKGRDMTDGTLLKLTQTETSSLTTGKVLDIHTESSSLMNGAFEVTSNSVETGQIMRIRGDKITSANMIDILSSSSNVNAESQIISINAGNALNGSIVDVKSPSLMHGNVILLTSAKLTSGKIINMIDNTDLTSGKLLHVKSSSSHASNPLQFDFPRVTNGTGITMNVQNLQNGVGILLDIDTGAALRTTHHDTTYDGSG
jgi:hypothetical protein